MTGQADGIIATYLDPAPRDLSKRAFMRTKPEKRLLKSVMNGVPGTSMAPWGRVLGEERAGALVDHVLENLTGGEPRQPSGRKVPAMNPVAYSEQSVGRGEAIFLTRCWGCHGKKADGHGPNAEDIVPRPRNLRNTPFIESVGYQRLHGSIKYGVQGTAMPAFIDLALSDEEIGDLINFVYSVSLQPPEGTGAGPADAGAVSEEVKQ